MTARDADVWLPFVDSFVDGTLQDADAVRLGLAAESSPELRAAIDDARALHAALARMPVETPSADFDARIIASVPLARYASAPRRGPVVAAIGELAPSFVLRWAGRFGKGLSALAVAWILAVAVGSTALRTELSEVGLSLGARLQTWAEASSSSAIVGPLAGAASAAYDACFGALGSMAGVIGLGLTIFLLGAALGGVVLWAVARRRSVVDGRAEHHA